MSLLLDALKKAAQEKQKASEGIDKSESVSQPIIDTATPAEEHLVLTLDEDVIDEEKSEREKSREQYSEQAITHDEPLEIEKSSATTATVSDEALQLLVYKTNKQHRRSQKIIWGSIISGALFILLAGAISYYYSMLEDVEALERKHELAMRVVQNQPVTKPHILQSMQESKAAGDKVISTERKPAKQSKAVVADKPVSAPAKQTGRTVTIQKTEKIDPVSTLLHKAWQAYAIQDYAEAERAYSEVLHREPRNRDALLGDAAIAVKKADYTRARSAYSLLLRLDPRDPIATSALAGLDEAEPDAFGESRLKFMLQQQPDATHIHFALGNHYAKQKKWPQAQSEYFSAWQGNSDNADYAFNLAVSLDQIGKHKQAQRFYETSLEHAVKQNISFSVDAVKKRLAQLAQR